MNKAAFNPIRYDVDLYDCDVEGEIPDDLCGTYYQVGANRQYPARFADDAPFSADGIASMFRFSDGACDYRASYVRTQRLLAERNARKALFGKYRNPSTSDPSVRDISHGVANTHIVWHANRLMALKEDSPPVLLDPDTLETLDNYYTFAGELTSCTFTAHPKIDANSGEMIAFGYEAKGELSRDMVVYAFDRNGNKTWERWFEAPYVSLMHDMAITPDYVLIPTSPMISSREQLDSGAVHWGYARGHGIHVAVIPRGANGKAVRWFEGPERNMAHTLSALQEGDKLFLDGVVSDGNPLPFFPALDGSPFDPAGAVLSVRRWTLDLKSNNNQLREDKLVAGIHSGLPRIDDRRIAGNYRYGFSPEHDPALPFDSDYVGMIGGPASNVLARFNIGDGTIDKVHVGPTHDLSEPIFAPRGPDVPEGDGYILAVAYNHAARHSELVIVDAMRMEDGVVARVLLPFQAPPQVHGSWVARQDYAKK